MFRITIALVVIVDIVQRLALLVPIEATMPRGSVTSAVAPQWLLEGSAGHWRSLAAMEGTVLLGCETWLSFAVRSSS